MAAPSIVGIVLAAGKSRRFGSDKRQYRLPNGRSVLQQTIEQALQALPAVVVVLGAEDTCLQQSLCAAIGDSRLQVILASESDDGMAHSLAAGVAASASAAGWVILLGDMPFIKTSTIRAVAAGLQQAEIVQPMHQEGAGHPVAFSASFGDALQSLQGDQGARSIIEDNIASRLLLLTADAGIHQDIDIVDDLSHILLGKSQAINEEQV
jgi:molybdenum cofactor cytidylyltransferase